MAQKAWGQKRNALIGELELGSAYLKEVGVGLRFGQALGETLGKFLIGWGVHVFGTGGAYPDTPEAGAAKLIGNGAKIRIVDRLFGALLGAKAAEHAFVGILNDEGMNLLSAATVLLPFKPSGLCLIIVHIFEQLTFEVIPATAFKAS